MLSYVLVFVGGGCGSVARFLCSGFFARQFGEAFPWGTLFVNVIGCFVVGVLAGLAVPEGRWMISPSVRQFLVIGFCGGYTTFSSFSLQSLTLAQGGEWSHVAANIILSIVCCFIGVWLGYVLANSSNVAAQ